MVVVAGVKEGCKECLPGFWLGSQSPERMAVPLLRQDLGGGGGHV